MWISISIMYSTCCTCRETLINYHVVNAALVMTNLNMHASHMLDCKIPWGYHTSTLTIATVSTQCNAISYSYTKLMASRDA